MEVIILSAFIGLVVGAAGMRFVKVQKASGWTNREFDGTSIIFITGIAFLLLIILTYMKPAFGKEETTKIAFEIIKTLFTFMCGYTFKTGVEQKSNGMHDPRNHEFKIENAKGGNK